MKRSKTFTIQEQVAALVSAQGSYMNQPTEEDSQILFNQILGEAYLKLLKLPVKQESYEEYVRAEAAEGGKFDD